MREEGQTIGRKAPILGRCPSGGRQSFCGLRQSGIITAQPAAALVAMMERLPVRTAAFMAGKKPSSG